MSKTKCYYHEMEIDFIERFFRGTGKITKSNFLKAGAKYSIPMDSKYINQGIIKEGTKVKLTWFVDEDNVDDGPGRIKLDADGMKIEVWDDLKGCWDLVYEKFLKDS